MSGKFQVAFNESLCKGAACAICQYACLRGVWPLREAQPAGCTGCRRCMLLCPEMAIEITEAGAGGEGEQRSTLFSS